MTLNKENASYYGAIYIRASAKQVYDAMTNASEIAKYHIGGSGVEGEVGIGKSVTLSLPNGFTILEMVAKEMVENKRFVTSFVAHWSGDNPDDSTIEYDLEETENNGTKLSWCHYDLTSQVEGFEDGGWQWASSLKSYLETGEALRG